MAKIRKIYDQTIKPDGSKTTIYPITSTRAVYTPEGETLDSYLKDGYFHGADLAGYKVVYNVYQLPTTETSFGYLMDSNLYVWVGTGGNTLDGKYQNCGPFRGPQGYDGHDGTPGRTGSAGLQGPKGDKGDKGDSGVSLGDVTLTTALAETETGMALDASVAQYKIGFVDGAQEIEDVPSNYYNRNEVDQKIDVLQSELDQIHPNVIYGDVTNNPDGEDITTNGAGRLCLKDRAGQDGMAYYILRKDKSFAEQVIHPNAIYEIRYDFDLGGESVTIPEGCSLKYNGGKLSNGTIVNCCNIDNSSDGILFSEITFVSPCEQLVKLSWFDYESDSDALSNAAKFKHVDGTGSWMIDKTVEINNDFQLENGSFSCEYGITNIRIASADIESASYNSAISQGDTEINVTSSFSDAEAVEILSDDLYYKTTRATARSAKRGEMMIIDKVLSNKITFNTSSGTILSYSTNIKLNIFKPIKVSLKSCKFHSTYNDSSDEGGALVNISYSVASVSDCEFGGCSLGLALGSCFDSVVTGCTFGPIYPWAAVFSGTTCNSVISNCSFDTNRHAWTTLGEGGVVKFCQVSNNVCRKSLYAICSHSNAFGITVSNNLVADSNGGIGSYAPECTIKDNVVKNINGWSAIYLVEAGGINPVVQGNVIELCPGSGSAIRNTDLDIESDTCAITPTFCIIKGNVIRNCANMSGIMCDYSKTDDTAVPITIDGNQILSIGYTAIGITGIYVAVTNNFVHDVNRSQYVSMNIVSPESTGTSRFASIIGNMVSMSSSSTAAIVKDFYKVNYYLNATNPARTVTFDNCDNVTDNPFE